MGPGGEPGFVDVSTSDGTARACAETLTEGWVVAVEGRLEYREWENAAGIERVSHSVRADLVQPVQLSTGASAAPDGREDWPDIAPRRSRRDA